MLRVENEQICEAWGKKSPLTVAPRDLLTFCTGLRMQGVRKSKGWEKLKIKEVQLKKERGGSLRRILEVESFSFRV